MMKQTRCHYLNVLIPTVAASLLSVLVVSHSSKPFSMDFGSLLFLGWCSGHFFILLLLGIVLLCQCSSRTPTYALFAANVVACLVTLFWYPVVMDVVLHPTSSTSSIALLTFPIVGLPAGAIAFVAVYLVMWQLGKKQGQNGVYRPRDFVGPV